jgi:ubiquitin-conjugating enzyme E2 variant
MACAGIGCAQQFLVLIAALTFEIVMMATDAMTTPAAWQCRAGVRTPYNAHAMPNGALPRSLGLRLLAAIAIVVCSALWLVLAIRTWRSIDTPLDIGLAALALIVAGAAADWVSGLAHWFCDTFFDEDTPIIGAVLIQPFREHHSDPLAMTRHGFLEMNGNNCMGLVAPLAAIVWWGPASPAGVAATFLTWFSLFFFLAVAVTNRLHGWAHATNVPRVVRWLQSSGLILSPERHARHHRAPYAQAYCVTHGWMNGPLERVRFFERTTKLLMRLGVPNSRDERS